MSKLDDIFENYVWVEDGDDTANPEFKQKIKDLMLELIGEDEYKFGDDFDIKEVSRDQLRAELRAKVKDL